MAMSENEAIEILKYYDKQPYFFSRDASANYAFKMAIQALEKVQALEENETYQIYREYLAIGTIEEFKALKEKAEPKEMDRYYCPICRHYFEDTDAYNYCPVCGQKMKSILE